MDKVPTVPKWALIHYPKIPQMPPKFSTQLSAQTQKFGIFGKKLSLGVHSPWHMVFMREIRTHSQWEPKQI